MHQESDGTVTDDIARRGSAPRTGAEEPLATVRLNPIHRVQDFTATKSDRVTRFLREQAACWVERRLCGAFILPDPNDHMAILGYYTLSQFVVSRDEMKNKHKSGQLIKDVPLALIGFMGKQDGSRKGIGAALLVDAARRAHRNIDIPAWGLVLDCEGGQQNEKLWNWYRAAGFIPSKSNAGRMYAPYENLIPELAPLR
jgi:hypothetical protein